MGFDPVTFVAQVVNFLVLVWLLKRLLFGRIREAMERRERRIAERLQEAVAARREAEEEGRELRRRREELEERREEMLDQAREAARRAREEGVEEARRRVGEEEERWRRGLEEEKDAFLRELRRGTAAEILEVCRRALAELAERSLEVQVARRLVERIRRLDDASRDRLAQALAAGRDEGADESEQPAAAAGAEVEVWSAFAVDEAEREALRRALEEIGPVGRMRWRQSGEPGFGFDVRVGGWHLGWSLETYLDALATAVDERLGELEGAGWTGERPEPAGAES